MPKPHTLTLASRSPRRLELLTQLRLGFEVMAADIDEARLESESVDEYVQRLAICKAKTVQARSGGLVMGADTVVTVGDEIFGKPAGRSDAVSMLRRLSGSVHEVKTGVALTDGRRVEDIVVSTIVRFRQISDQEIDRYWSTGEPVDKAGSYGIQGIGAIFVDAIVGSYSNVVGLPLAETAALLARYDIFCLAPASD